MRRLVSAVAVLAAVAIAVPKAQSRPRLVVLIVVDQMRADYIERFRDDWSSGLRRLVDQGAWFTRAAYPYLTTVTCAGHATVSTGAYPHVHGIFANTWFDRNRAAVIPCTEDPEARPVAYGRPDSGRPGPANLEIPSLADQVRAGGGHVVTLALKARSAIMLAGHGGDAVTWVADTLDSWETSTAFAQEPVPQVSAFVAANPLSADYGKSWSRMLPPSRYRDTDEGLGENPPKGWAATFPHVLKGDSGNGKPDTSYYNQWQRSPFANAYVVRMATAMVDAFELGSHDKPDFLGVSFSSPDLVGHSFGPHSQEVQDIYAQLDAAIGDLLNHLDKTVGAGAYVVGLSADHGVTDIPEQLKAEGRDAGRMSASALLNLAEKQAQTDLGEGQYFSRLNGNDIYFAPGMLDVVKRKPGELAAIVDALSRQPGVRHVYTSVELAGGATASDPQLRAAALSYYKGRSGDLIVSPKPGWMFTTAGTTHGTATPDDQRVPVLLFGAGVKSGRYDQPATPADLAPTLARIAGVPLPRAEGRVLREAVR
jgi:predicted AlkP superfamily pyrophosphatase or phosphodiesterase